MCRAHGSTTFAAPGRITSHGDAWQVGISTSLHLIQISPAKSVCPGTKEDAKGPDTSW